MGWNTVAKGFPLLVAIADAHRLILRFVFQHLAEPWLTTSLDLHHDMVTVGESKPFFSLPILA